MTGELPVAAELDAAGEAEPPARSEIDGKRGEDRTEARDQARGSDTTSSGAGPGARCATGAAAHPQTADSSGAAKALQATIDRAQGLLNSVPYQTQSEERKKAYNDVKNFIVQAQEAMKVGNFVFGQAVATKAETLAKELAGK